MHLGKALMELSQGNARLSTWFGEAGYVADHASSSDVADSLEEGVFMLPFVILPGPEYLLILGQMMLRQ